MMEAQFSLVETKPMSTNGAPPKLWLPIYIAQRHSTKLSICWEPLAQLVTWQGQYSRGSGMSLNRLVYPFRRKYRMGDSTACPLQLARRDTRIRTCTLNSRLT